MFCKGESNTFCFDRAHKTLKLGLSLLGLFNQCIQIVAAVNYNIILVNLPMQTECGFMRKTVKTPSSSGSKDHHSKVRSELVGLHLLHVT
jgi:hypothetical protein